MRRFLTLVFLLLFTIPFGVSISGCSKKAPVVFCNGGDSGAVVGQVHSITLSPQIFGISLNQTEIGQATTPVATDCKGTTESVTSYTYAMFDANGKPDITVADVVPSGVNAGKLCGGTWNRQTGGGIADFTTCTPTGKSGTAYLVASGAGATSNSLPIFIHPVVTSVVLGGAPSTDCLNDPATNCSPAAYNTQVTGCTINAANGCCTTPVPPPETASTGISGCLSQGTTSQLIARVYQGTDTTVKTNNISCFVGHLDYTVQPSSIVTIDQNGVATAQSPGSAVISATISQAGSSAGFFSTCPPTSIKLSVPLATGSSVVVNPNNPQPINATVTDMNGVVLTSVPLEFVSTTPTTIPVSSAGSVTPSFPGAGAITAICQPPACNPSPLNQIGLNGNGKPVTSNAIDITAPGINSTDLYIASTESLYLVPVDFTTNSVGTQVRLPYVPNSMVISVDGSSIYMGSSFALMTFNATTNTLASQDTTVTGNVLAVSPDGTTLVITDPVRQLVYLYSTTTSAATGSTSASTAGVVATYGGVATHAEFTPDSQTAYITMGNVTTPATPTTPAVIAPNNTLLIHSAFTGWFVTSATSNTASDVAITVPSVGAFFAGNTTTALGSCPLSTPATDVTGQTTTTNIFYPDAGVAGGTTDRIAATNDGQHILGATAAPPASLTDFAISSPSGSGGSLVPGVPIGACPDAGLKFTATPVLNGAALPGVTASAITGVIPASDSTIAFITYTGSGGVVPTYTPSASGPGTLGSISLTPTTNGTPTAPVAGVVSADNQTFYAGTSGDNVVHVITKTNNVYQDNIMPQSSTPSPFAPIVPQLPCAPGASCTSGVGAGTATPNLLVQKPRKAIS
jgi:trimeric autotransporter adhesin